MGEEQARIGRPTVSADGEVMQARPVRMTDAQWKKCKLLGGAEWIRARIDKSRAILQPGIGAPGCRETYIYTHAYPDGRVFYVGAGKGTRWKNFNNRNARHKAIAGEVGRANVVITLYPCPSHNYLHHENMMIARVLQQGAELCQDVRPARIARRMLEDEQRADAAGEPPPGPFGRIVVLEAVWTSHPR